MKKALLIIILLLFLPLVGATLDKPTWKIGLYWKYQIKYSISSISHNLTIKIIDKEIIEIEGKNYNVWNISYISDAPMVGNKIIYMSINDFAIVKEVNIMKNVKSTIVYYPPTPLIKYGVDVRDQWKSNYQIKQYFENFLETTVNVTVNSICLSKENVTVPAGSYECYKVIQKRTYEYDGKMGKNEKQIFYYSPSAGNWVKMERYEGDTKNFEMLLIKTNYGSKKIPLPPYIMLLAFAIAILMKIIYKAMRFTDNENSS